MQRAAGRRGTGKKTALGEAFQRQIAAEVEALIGPQALAQLDLEAIEIAARREALKVAAYAVAQRLNADRTDHAGPALPCACGHDARYAGRHDKTIQTALGTMTLQRAYYHCAACQRGYFPRDDALGIGGTSLSPALTRMIARVRHILAKKHAFGISALCNSTTWASFLAFSCSGTGGFVG